MRPPASPGLLGPATLATAAILLTAPVAAQGDVRPSVHHDYRAVTVVDGLVHPWGIDFLPGGDMLVTERPGRLRIVRGGRLLPDPVPGVPPVFARGQGGLLDVAAHPDFASNRLVYLSYSKPLGDGQSTTAVARGVFRNDRLTGVEEVFEADSRGGGHYGSRLVFDGAGGLFITVGDRQVPAEGDLEAHPAQELSNHHGVVVRIREDGEPPADNPFAGVAGAHPDIWSYGHRNIQGMVLHPVTGDLWATEHGPQGGDELNLIQPGLNYGWPLVGYGVNYGSGTAIHAGTHREGLEQPVHVWVPSVGTSGLMVYTGERFPEWRGDLFAGGLSGEQIARLELDGRDVTREETLLLGLGRVRDIAQGPDGYIYVAIDGRRGAPTPIVRLEPVGGED